MTTQKNNLSIEAQIAELEKRAARARVNPERCQAALNKVFEGIKPSDRVELYPEKIKALVLQLAEDHHHNMEIMRKNGLVGMIKILESEEQQRGSILDVNDGSVFNDI